MSDVERLKERIEKRFLAEYKYDVCTPGVLRILTPYLYWDGHYVDVFIDIIQPQTVSDMSTCFDPCSNTHPDEDPVKKLRQHPGMPAVLMTHQVRLTKNGTIERDYDQSSDESLNLAIHNVAQACAQVALLLK